jgi:NTP pyrophosphatase (non-canonical NTP hydrolase)
MYDRNLIVSFVDYQWHAARTARRDAPDRLHVSLLGLGSEYGELLDEFQHAAEQARDLDLPHVAEELGDMLWRISDIAETLGLSLEGIAAHNISKLRRRHPVTFTAGTSLARMDKAADAPAPQN